MRSLFRISASSPERVLVILLIFAFLASPTQAEAAAARIDPRLELQSDFAIPPGETEDNQLVLSTSPARTKLSFSQAPEVEDLIRDQQNAIPSLTGIPSKSSSQAPAEPLVKSPIETAAETASGQTPALRTEASGLAYVEQAGPYLDFIRDHLLQRVGSGSLASFSALAETEKPLGDNNVWFWTDDNAKALEAYLVPEAYARYQETADSLMKFIRRMSDGPIILRRIARPALNIVSRDPHNFEVSTGLMNYHGNLEQGEIALSYQFHDGRGGDAIRLTGNWISFELNGRSYQFDVEKSITSARLIEQGGSVILEYVSTFSDWFAPVARATYSYTIDPALTLLRLDILVEAQNHETLDNVRVTASMDRLADLKTTYQKFCSMRLSGLSCENAPKDRTILAQGGLDWFSLIQLGNLGFSYAIHVQPFMSEQLVEVVAEETRKNRFNRVYPIYNIDHVSVMAPGRIREASLLTSGGLYQSMEVYGDLIKMAGDNPGLDFSASYDYGAELNAMGCYYMFASSGRYEPLRRRDDPDVVSIKVWFDRHLSMFQRNFLTEQPEQTDKDKRFPYLFGRGLAFAILGADCMRRATGEDSYLSSMRDMVEILLRSQRREGRPEYEGNFRCRNAASYLDCQGAIILALARAALVLDDPRLGPAVVDGINAVKLIRGEQEAKEQPTVVARSEGALFVEVGPGSRGERNGMLWGFTAGLLLRGLAAADFASNAGRLEVDQTTRQHMQELAAAATDYIHASTVPRGELREILTSYHSTETNSESQPWMLLGLYPIDPIIAQVQPRVR